MPDVHTARVSAVTDFEHAHMSKRVDFICKNQQYCLLCRQDVQECDIDEHVESADHMAQYGEYLSKYSQLMHVSASMHPNVSRCDQRLCIAYDLILDAPRSTRDKLWDTSFRYALGQRTYTDLLRCAAEDSPEDTAAAGEDASRSSLCVCCWSSSRSTLLRPCKHVVVCRTCANRLTECPVCRQTITEIEDVFC